MSQLGYDYERQAWVKDGRYVRCGHPENMDCGCFGRQHEGEAATVGHSPTVGLFGVLLQRALERADREADRERAGLRAEARAQAQGQKPLTFPGERKPPAICDDYGEPT